MSKERNRDDGLRKLCECPRRTWAKCEHPWHFDYKWNGERYRFTLDRKIGRLAKDAKGKWHRDRGSLGDRITSKTVAAQEQERLRTAIRTGAIQQQPDTRPQRETLTLAQLMATYRTNYLEVHRAVSLNSTLKYQIGMILRTELECLDGTRRALGDWLVPDITTDVIEAYQRARMPTGRTGTNRDLEVLRGLFNWATHRKRKLAPDNPFLDGAKAAIKMAPELARRRRLRPGEGEKILAACNPHLRAIVEAAIETGCRRGELLTLQWYQVRFTPKAELFFPAEKTKTQVDRTVPISARLLAILEMRRHDPAGDEHPGTAYVFGNAVGEPVKSIKRAWERVVLLAHGYRAEYVVKPQDGAAKAVRTAALTAESRARLRAIDLHFHDLRREAGSRWLDAGVPLHRIRAWLGHVNISQTSTYLMAESADDDDAMKRFDERRAKLTPIDTESETGGIHAAHAGTITDNAAQLSSGKTH
jgi:integrase